MKKIRTHRLARRIEEQQLRIQWRAKTLGIHIARDLPGLPTRGSSRCRHFRAGKSGR